MEVKIEMVCVYKGEKYFAVNENGKIVICTYNGKKEGFTQMTVYGKTYVNYYERTLEPSEIESLYHERIYFQYKGMVLTAGGINKRGIDENSFLVFGDTEKLAREYGFKGNFRDGYERFIKLEEIERIIVKKTPVKGFEEFFNVEETEVVEKENVKEWIKLAASLQPDPRDQEWP